MADKIMTIRRDQVGRRIGRLSNDEMARLDRAIRIFLGLTR
jgi:mRNA interferase MazF